MAGSVADRLMFLLGPLVIHTSHAREKKKNESFELVTYDPGSQNPRLCRCAGTYPKRWFSAASFIEALSRVLLFLLHRSRLLLVNRKEKKSSKAKLSLFFILSLLLLILTLSYSSLSNSFHKSYSSLCLIWFFHISISI